MTEARLLKNRRTEICKKVAEMRLRQRDVEMLDRCGEIEFSLYGGEGDALVEGVATLKVSGATPGLNGR